jgi:uncharacterized membrane protein
MDQAQQITTQVSSLLSNSVMVTLILAGLILIVIAFFVKSITSTIKIILIIVALAFFSSSYPIKNAIQNAKENDIIKNITN